MGTLDEQKEACNSPYHSELLYPVDLQRPTHREGMRTAEEIMKDVDEECKRVCRLYNTEHILGPITMTTEMDPDLQQALMEMGERLDEAGMFHDAANSHILQTVQHLVGVLQSFDRREATLKNRNAYLVQYMSAQIGTPARECEDATRSSRRRSEKSNTKIKPRGNKRDE